MRINSNQALDIALLFFLPIPDTGWIWEIGGKGARPGDPREPM